MTYYYYLSLKPSLLLRHVAGQYWIITLPTHLIHVILQWRILPATHGWNATYKASASGRAGQRLDKLFLACVVPNRHHHHGLLTGAGRREWGSKEEEEHCLHC